MIDGYVFGFAAPVPTENKAKYIEFAEMFQEVARTHGALSYAECWADDVPDGETTSFPMAVKLEPGETVVFGWVAWPSKEAGDAAMQQMMQDPRMDPEKNPMPFDGRRMIFGGFRPILTL